MGPLHAVPALALPAAPVRSALKRPRPVPAPRPSPQVPEDRVRRLLAARAAPAAKIAGRRSRPASPPSSTSTRTVAPPTLPVVSVSALAPARSASALRMGDQRSAVVVTPRRGPPPVAGPRAPPAKAEHRGEEDLGSPTLQVVSVSAPARSASDLFARPMAIDIAGWSRQTDGPVSLDRVVQRKVANSKAMCQRQGWTFRPWALR